MSITGIDAGQGMEFVGIGSAFHGVKAGVGKFGGSILEFFEVGVGGNGQTPQSMDVGNLFNHWLVGINWFSDI